MVMSLLMQLFSLAAPALTGLLVNSVVPHSDNHLLNVLGVGIIGAVLFQYLSSLTRSHLLLYLRTHLDAQMTLGFVEHLASLPYSFFQQTVRGRPDHARQQQRDDSRDADIEHDLECCWMARLQSSYLAILLAASPTLAVIVIILGLMQALVFGLSYRRYQELMSQDLQAQSKSQSHLVQMLSGIETLKASGAEDRWSSNGRICLSTS